MPVFQPVDSSMNFAQAEAKVLFFWKSNRIFEKSLKLREPAKDTKHWVFYEGPPTANGKPHPGHVLTRVVKDLFPRYKTMCGYYVPRKAGWDTHGLPVEIEVEKELKLNGKTEVEKYGVEPFVRKCMDSVFRYTTDWENLTERIGFWIDLKDAYVTYHQSYVESVWWSLQQLFEKGLLYRGHKILPWCPHCQTALSSHEVGLGYQEVEDPSVFVTFRDVNWEQNKTSFLAWTTTPWTLPSNAGLAVKSDTEYSYVKVGEETLIMASALVKQVMGKMKFEVTKTETGTALLGRRYKPLFDWATPTLAEKDKANAWKVCAADFVTLDTGSGIVHMAPAFGADDYALGQKEGLPVIQLVGPDGNFTKECGAFAGRFVKEADNDIIRDLKARGLLLKREAYKHDYPFCWRCKNPLIYYARGGWFVRTTREISHVIDNNKKVDWHPEHIRDGRFGSFLDSNIDWALSRERYWGTPLNVWVCECGHQEAVSSFAELSKKPNVKGLDAFDVAKKKDPTLNDHLRVHKPWIDAATFACSKCGKDMKRTSEVIDCWYDSGAMPFAQWGYPHAEGSKEKFNLAFPADFISEAIDQTRGWFYSLIAESTLLNDVFAQTSGKTAPYPQPYKTCLVLGHVCDEKGEKMSKSKGNYLDPNLILAEEGADALRWFFYSSTNPWTSARFSRPAVREAQKEFLIKLRNVYSFFTIYANIDGFDPGDLDAANQGQTQLDRWIISELHQTIRVVRACLDAYDIYGGATALNSFVESLSNWYVRRSRDRFWSSWQTPNKDNAHDREKMSAYWTLYECLITTSQLAAPFVPFMAEEIWQNLSRGPMGEDVPESVHLCEYPQADPSVIDEALTREFSLVREVASLGRAARSGAKLKTRQPLSKVVVVLSDTGRDEIVRKHEQVLLDELNVKAIEIAHKADTYVNYELKPNFKAIGAKFRESVPHIKEALSKANAADLRAQFAASGKINLPLASGKSAELSPEEVEVSLKAKEGYAAASGRTVVVVLDTHLTPELLDEGVARELISRINEWRGDLKLPYEQRIKLAVKGSAKLEGVAKKFAEHIAKETLAAEQAVGETPGGYETLEAEVDGEKATLALKRV
jgi:isoleucyl-tRNA synthetase